MDIGLKEEIELLEKSSKKKKIIVSVFLIVSCIVCTFGIGYIIVSANNGKTSSNTAHDSQSIASHSANQQPEAIQSSTDTAIDPPPASPIAQPAEEESAMIALQAQMDNENHQLRRQWVGDAYAVSADMAKMGSLISKGDSVSLKEAQQLDSSITGRAISLGILQGLPDTHESQLKQTAATDVKNAIVKYADALGWMEAYLQDSHPVWLTTARQKLAEASSLNQQLSNKVKEAENYIR